MEEEQSNTETTKQKDIELENLKWTELSLNDDVRISLNGKDTCKLDMLSPYQLDVGVDNFNYTPVSWNQVKEAIQWQVDNKRIYAKRNLSKWKLFVLKIKRIFKK